MTLWEHLTDDGRDAMVVALVGSLSNSGVPEHLRAGLVRYFTDGILPGGFLQAILCGDLLQAVERYSGGAAPAAYTISAVWEFLVLYEPAGRAWGSREKVLAWTTTPDRLEV